MQQMKKIYKYSFLVFLVAILTTYFLTNYFIGKENILIGTKNLFNKESKISCIKVNKIETGATYPRMLSNTLQKDLGYRIKYSLEKSIKDWLNELKTSS